ncbi:hypothetical protein ACFV2H_28665 [Streptomyces sp. NPDC059629]|uniref:hypothetical protein n=1 Tax=Streptomyces sp. NPDC059629 TaxID=3346889 RepID=UPI0036BD764E
MIESQVPDLGAVSLRDLLDSDDIALRRGVVRLSAQVDREPMIAATGDPGDGDGGGAERVD